MKTKTHTNKLQKSSGLFMQLGLVLTLAIVYALFEHRSEVDNPTQKETASNYSEDDLYFKTEVFEIEREIVKQEQAPQKKVKFVDDIIISNTPKEIATIIINDPIDDEVNTTTDISNQLVKIEDPDIGPDEIDFIKIEDAPIFPGCEKMKTQADRKACFVKKMDKFIQRKFNSDLANQLGLTSGVKRIYVKFKITKTGEIEISAVNAPHVRLEKEGERVIGLLPKMIPGKQRGVPVNVTYMKPIAFSVQ